MAPSATARLLGRLELRVGGAPVTLDSARAESLVGYLLVRVGVPQARQQVAFQLWPDSREGQARTNLRHLLHMVRRRWPAMDDYVAATPSTLCWRAGTTWLDVAEFERLTGGDDATVAALREAVDLYGGDLLEGCHDEWLLADRDRLRHGFQDLLAALADRLEGAGDPPAAAAYAERLLRADPLREETYRRLMRLYAAAGDRARAVRVFHACSATLDRELGIEPSAQTRAAYDALLPTEPDDAPTRAIRVAGPRLVGRAPELEAVTAAWRAADAGRAGVVLLRGEAGVGKTRLLEELQAGIQRRGALTALARCHAGEGPLPFGPVIGWLRSPDWYPRLARMDVGRLTDLARLVPEVLGPAVAAPDPLPDEDRHRLFEAVAQAVLAAGAPLLLLVDDLQHADRTTCQLVHYVVRAHPTARLLVAGTVRAGDAAPVGPWTDLVGGLRAMDRVTEVDVSPLSPVETAQLAERLTGTRWPAARARRLWTDTGGNPLFVVEWLRAGWPGDAIPPRVHAVIAARLGQLSGPARDLAGVAAIVGTDFTSDLLGVAGGTDDDTVVRALDEMWRRSLVRATDGGGYDFVHDRVREVVAAELGPARRAYLHRRIAAALAQRHGVSSAADVSARIAGHFERAGDVLDAVAWLSRAAEAAIRLDDAGEAVGLLERAIPLARTQPESAERDRRELALLGALPGPLVAVEGYASTRLSEVHVRARQLAARVGTEPPPPLLRSMAMASMSGGDFAAARTHAGLLHDEGERRRDDVLVVEGACTLGFADFWAGDFPAARAHLTEVVERFRVEDERAHLVSYGQDPLVAALARLGNTEWFLGDPVAAEAAAAAALSRAATLEHRFSRATAFVFTALLALDSRDDPRVRANAAALGALGVHAPPIRLSTEALAGYVQVLDGDLGAGLSRIARARADAARARPAPGLQAMVGRVHLAAAHRSGDPSTLRRAAEDYLTLGGAARVWAPEACRLRDLI